MLGALSPLLQSVVLNYTQGKLLTYLKFKEFVPNTLSCRRILLFSVSGC